MNVIPHNEYLHQKAVGRHCGFSLACGGEGRMSMLMLASSNLTMLWTYIFGLVCGPMHIL